MADMRDVIYHGIRQQIRRVLEKMTDEEIDRGIDAFETGQKNWSHCFFARALEMDKALAPARWAAWRFNGVWYTDPVQWIMVRLGIDSPVPIKLVYQTFDGKSTQITTAEMRQFITDLRDDRRPNEVMALLRGVNYDAPYEVSTTCG